MNSNAALSWFLNGLGEGVLAVKNKPFGNWVGLRRFTLNLVFVFIQLPHNGLTMSCKELRQKMGKKIIDDMVLSVESVFER